MRSTREIIQAGTVGPSTDERSGSVATVALIDPDPRPYRRRLIGWFAPATRQIFTRSMSPSAPHVRNVTGKDRPFDGGHDNRAHARRLAAVKAQGL